LIRPGHDTGGMGIPASYWSSATQRLRGIKECRSHLLYELCITNGKIRLNMSLKKNIRVLKIIVIVIVVQSPNEVEI
jgi:hypothetical protein